MDVMDLDYPVGTKDGRFFRWQEGKWKQIERCFYCGNIWSDESDTNRCYFCGEPKTHKGNGESIIP